mgnify:CR=1 FL=1
MFEREKKTDCGNYREVDVIPRTDNAEKAVRGKRGKRKTYIAICAGNVQITYTKVAIAQLHQIPPCIFIIQILLLRLCNLLPLHPLPLDRPFRIVRPGYYVHLSVIPAVHFLFPIKHFLPAFPCTRGRGILTRPAGEPSPSCTTPLYSPVDRYHLHFLGMVRMLIPHTSPLSGAFSRIFACLFPANMVQYKCDLYICWQKALTVFPGTVKAFFLLPGCLRGVVTPRSVCQ